MVDLTKFTDDRLVLGFMIAANEAGRLDGQGHQSSPHHKQVSARREAYRAEVLRRFAERDAQLAAVTQQRDAAVKALQAVEWFGGLGDVCPMCRQRKPNGHTADCQLAVTLNTLDLVRS